MIGLREVKRREKKRSGLLHPKAFPWYSKRDLYRQGNFAFSPYPTPLLLFLLAFLCALLTFGSQLLKRWITLSTEKRKCFSLMLTYPLDGAIQRLNIPGLNAWIRPPQPLVQEVFFPFSLRVSVETHLRLFWGKEDLTDKKNQLPNFSQGRVLSRFYFFVTKERGHIKQINKNFVLKTCLCLFTKLLFNAYTISVLLYINKSLKSLDRKQKFTFTRRILNS